MTNATTDHKTEAQNELIAAIRAGRRVSAPIFAVTTPDQSAVERLICETLNGDTVPKIAWDLVRGARARNARGLVILQAIGEERLQQTTQDPVSFLELCLDFPENTIVFFHSANRFLEDAAVMQGMLNLRDEYKSNRRTLILLGPAMRLPSELVGSVVEVDDPLPDDERLCEIVRAQLEAVDADQLEFEATDDLVAQTAQMLKGTMAFGAEQSAAMSLKKSGFDGHLLNTAAKKLIEQTVGLTFEVGGETFDDVGGLDFAKDFGKRLAGGPERPTVIVRLEELEKAMGGATGGDLSGTSADALQVLLSEMEDNGWSGILAYGAPGAGKSLYSKSLANTIGAKGLRFDPNATKGSLVGQSEQNIRAAMKTLRTIGGKRVFFIASVNKLESLPPELQRRFRCGVWFFDLPSDEERPGIWAINRAKFEIPEDYATPDAADLTGADIRNICETSRRLGCSLIEALDYVVPLKTQSPAAISEARARAKDRFIDASRGGVYKLPSERKAKNAKRRAVKLED
jgi:hypothetical protein